MSKLLILDAGHARDTAGKKAIPFMSGILTIICSI